MKTAAIRKRPSARVRRAIRRRAFGLVLLAILAAVLLCRHVPANRIPAYRTAIDYPAPPPLVNKPVRVHYHNVPLSQAFADLSRQAGIGFNVDWATLRAEGVVADTNINCDSGSDEPVPLSTALRLLRPNEDVEIAADFMANPLFVSTYRKVATSAPAAVVVYPMSGVFRISDPWCYELYGYSRRTEALTELIQSVVQEDYWRVTGGDLGQIEWDSQSDALIVTATPGMHYQIRELLDELRRQK